MLTFEPNIDSILGGIPYFLSERDSRPAREQLNHNYSHGGGWRPLSGWKLNSETKALSYPGDPPLYPQCRARLREEEIIVYHHAWVAIIQPDGSFEVARID